MTVLIAGGGIGGLCTAIALSHHGIRSHICEQAQKFSTVGAGIQVGPNGMRLLEHWGVTRLLADKGATPLRVRICDGLTGRSLNTVPLGDTAQKRYGAPYKVFHRAELQTALLEKARSQPHITISTGFHAEKFSQNEDGITLYSATGEEQRGTALIGADGLWSTTRRQLFPGTAPVFYGKSAWRAIISRDQSPEPFNRLETGLWMAPNAHLVHYPVLGGEAINIVAVITETFDQEGWNTAGQEHQLLDHYASWAKAPRRFLQSITGWQKWALYGLAPLPHWSRGRVTLLGDAAHPPIPFLAQGGVMAMEDAYVLAEQLKRYNDDYLTAFRRYEEQRRARAYRVMKTAHRLGKIYHMKGIMRQARNTVLGWKKPENLLADYDWLYGFEFATIS